MTEVLLWFAGTSLGVLAGTALVWFGMRSAIQRDIMTALSLKFVYECDRCDYKRDDYTSWPACERDQERHEKKHPPRPVSDPPQYFDLLTHTRYVKLGGK